MSSNGRLTTPEVCALARYSKSTLWKRIDAGQMPAPIDRGGGGFIFDRDAVLKALGMFEADLQTDPAAAPDWSFDPIAYKEAHQRRIAARRQTRRTKLTVATVGEATVEQPAQVAPR